VTLTGSLKLEPFVTSPATLGLFGKVWKKISIKLKIGGVDLKTILNKIVKAVLLKVTDFSTL